MWAPSPKKEEINFKGFWIFFRTSFTNSYSVLKVWIWVPKYYGLLTGWTRARPFLNGDDGLNPSFRVHVRPGPRLGLFNGNQIGPETQVIPAPICPVDSLSCNNSTVKLIENLDSWLLTLHGPVTQTVELMDPLWINHAFILSFQFTAWKGKGREVDPK